ncbi:hypothetical protein JZ751_019320 [Albula glossodonta]|uniref:Rho GTPase activating protein 4 n=1 Tax=Albula glossodonta TaxID=121402 RepID=A0A8T2MSP0_9TELE|nr:hypothetical protein JZ751_019320 [Albula glossodonta]
MEWCCPHHCRKEQSEQSVSQCWGVLLTQTRQESRDHGAMGDKDVGLQMQDELLKVTSELQLALKTYHQYHTDCLAAEGKLKEATRLEERKTGKSTELGLGQSGGQRRSSVKKMDRLMEKRQGKVQETQLKCTKARNDYLLSLAAANASMNKYYLQDICTLIDCTDLGYHVSLTRVMRGFLSNRHRIQENLRNGLQQLESAVSGLDQNQDRDALLQAHNTTLAAITLETEEADAPSSKLSLVKRRANQQETEGYYFTKVKEHLSGSSLISKLQAKHDLLKDAILKAEAIDSDPSRARPCSQYNHKLFSGDMLSFIQSSGQPIPLVVESCIRFINLHGLHHEGIFRVPGSQSVVNHIRDAFERGTVLHYYETILPNTLFVSYCTPAVLLLYSYALTPAVLLLYSYALTPAVLLLYSCCTHML